MLFRSSLFGFFHPGWLFCFVFFKDTPSCNRAWADRFTRTFVEDIVTVNSVEAVVLHQVAVLAVGEVLIRHYFLYWALGLYQLGFFRQYFLCRFYHSLRLPLHHRRRSTIRQRIRIPPRQLIDSCLRRNAQKSKFHPPIQKGQHCLNIQRRNY